MKKNESYVRNRGKLIMPAAKIADDLTADDPARKNWDRIFLNAVDRLAFEAGLIERRLHPTMKGVAA